MTSIRRALAHLISPRAFAIALFAVAVLIAGFLGAPPANASAHGVVYDGGALEVVSRTAPLLALFIVLSLLIAVALHVRRSSH